MVMNATVDFRKKIRFVCVFFWGMDLLQTATYTADFELSAAVGSWVSRFIRGH